MGARDELHAIYDQDGVLTADAVVDRARAVSSPLHDHFEWDDSEAAVQYRLTQAEGLIRRYKMTVEVHPEQTIRVREFSQAPDGGYAPTKAMLGDDRRGFVLEQARRELSALRRKYQGLVDFDELLSSELVTA